MNNLFIHSFVTERKRIDLKTYKKVHENQYDSMSESSIYTTVLTVENEYSEKLRYI